MNDLKKVLFISPNFPPVNAADMHRVRQLLINYDTKMYDIDIIAIKPEYSEAYSIDKLLLDTIPLNYAVYLVRAIPAKISKKLGIGSLSLRSFFHFLLKGNHLIRKKKYDLIFFSTTATHLMYLGTYWKKKFGIPFVLDIQDPWVNDYYLSRPSIEQPPHYKIHYKLDTYLESRTIPNASAIISVSGKYNEYFKKKYSLSSELIFETIPFGVEESDFQLLVNKKNSSLFDRNQFSIAYIGRGGHDLQESIKCLFNAFILGLKNNTSLFKKIHFYFIGTSYATIGNGQKTIEPLALQMGIENYVTEIPDRVSYFETIHLLQASNMLFIPGSIDIKYTPSKLYPYLLCKKPILAITNANSEMNQLAQKVDFVSLFHFNGIIDCDNLYHSISKTIEKSLQNDNTSYDISQNLIDLFSAKTMTKRVFDVFDNCLKK